MANAKRPPAPAADTKQRPVEEFRLGRVKAAVWLNQTEQGPRHNVTLVRVYKDGDAWKTSTSFSREDLPLVIKVADMAHTWIFQHGQDSSEVKSER